MVERISAIQLFTLIVTFEIGSTTLFALGIGAEQDAWIVIILSYVIGLILIWFFTQLPKYYPNKNFSEILNTTLGTKVAKPLLFLFGLYFLSQATHNFYEFGMLINMTALPKTPLLVILYLSIFVTIYILGLGVEVLARTAEIILPYLLTFFIITFIVNFFSDAFELDNLLPILGKGWKPILAEIHFVVAFPYSEMVVFVMFWHYTNKQQFIRKATYIAVSLATLLLIMNLIVMISILGAKLTANLEIPILETLLSINIANIITNLDSVAVFLMFFGGFFKTAIHFMGFCLAMTWVFNKTNPKWSLTIFGLLLPLIATFRFTGIEDQRWKGTEGGIYSILLFSSLIVLLVIIIFLKKKKTVRGEKKHAN